MKRLMCGGQLDACEREMMAVSNPHTQETVDSVPCATREDVLKAVQHAKQGRKLWAGTPLFERAEALRRFLDKMKENRDQIATLLCRETGKIISECYGEFDYTCDEFKGYIEVASHQCGQVLPSDAQAGVHNDMLLTVREPLGTVVCIIPFNFPIALFAHKVAPALVAGNAVIVKPSSENPLAVLRLVELLHEAGVPDSVVQAVTGRGSVVGNYLASSPDIDAISLTGSVESGIEVSKGAAPNLKRVFLELGGNDAMIVFADADMDLTIQQVFGGRIFNAGQICCGTKRYIVHRSRKKEFLSKLIAKLREIKAGDPQDPGTQLGCLISEKAALEVERQVQLTLSQGAKCVFGGGRKGAFFEPTVLDEVSPQLDIARDMEVFGPVMPVIEFESFEEAIRIANGTKFGLQNCLMTRDLNTAMKAAKALESGGVVVNGPSSYRTHDMPFGGHKASGIGVEGMSHTLEEMTVLKTIVLKDVLK